MGETMPVMRQCVPIDKDVLASTINWDNLTAVQRVILCRECPNIRGLTNEIKADPGVVGLCWDGGETLLHFAAEAGLVNVAQVLLEEGAFLEAVGQDGDTPLHRAVKNNNLQVLQLLLQSQASPHIVDTASRIPLHSAALLGNIQTVEMLLRAKSLIDTVDGFGFTPLDLAVGRDHAEVANLLIRYGAKTANATTALRLCEMGVHF